MSDITITEEKSKVALAQMGPLKKRKKRKRRRPLESSARSSSFQTQKIGSVRILSSDGARGRNLRSNPRKETPSRNEKSARDSQSKCSYAEESIHQILSVQAADAASGDC